MDSRVRFCQRQIIEEDKIGALFLCTFYGHTTLYLVLSLPWQFSQLFLFVQVGGGRDGWLFFPSVFKL